MATAPPSPPALNRDYERRPYWQATMPALPDRTARPLPETADVVVVGGGYTGVACARKLALDGAAVTLLESHQLGWGASTRNGGIIHPGFKWGPGELLRRYGDTIGSALFQETMAGYAFVRDLIRSEAIECEFRETGFLELAYGHSHVPELEDSRASLERVGVASRVVSGAELAAEIGTTAYPAAVAVEGSGLLHPGKWFAGLAGLAAGAGADLHEGTRARRIRRAADGRAIVDTERGQIVARDVVVATDGYTDGAAPSLRRRILPIGSFIIATEPLPESLASQIAPTGRAFFDTKNFLNYWHVSDDRRMLFGGRVSFMPTDVDRTARLLHRRLMKVHPQLAGYRVDFSWGGKVGLTMDRMPHVGRMGGVTYALGYCGTGVAMSTYLGTRVAEWLGGGTAPALARLDFPIVPAPYEGRPWFLPLVGEWFRAQDWLTARSRPRAGSTAGASADR
jgi:glycine/D-amino acid oxidase-like deaminating enzyme